MDLRPELMPPPQHEDKLTRLATLAECLDGCLKLSNECERWLREFNREAETSFEWIDFQGIYGGTDHTTWVRNVLSDRAAREIPDITHDELLELITRVLRAQGSEHEQYFWLRLLKANLPDPNLSDLIYWPGEYFGDGDNSRQLSPQEILDIALAAKPTELPPHRG
jgi:hypothetical protein